MRQVREIEHFWITLEDGCRLAARLWLPADAEDDPVPCILEYLPYRKRDATAERDEGFLARFAERGYASLRVDMRGSGDSDGLMLDEYTQEELDDGVAVIDWVAAQDWCNGAVGMIGISWGGFNGLQIAALRPEALKAVVTVCSTDDRYADDIHYKGGCLLNDNLTWSQQMLAYSTRAPDPLITGEGWKDVWLHRLENMPFLLANWLEHQRRDEFWKHGSVCEDHGAIQCPVLAVGGWADAYTNAIFRMVENLNAPTWGLVGPWVHKYPDAGWPEPRIDFVEEVDRWYAHWLKGEDTGITGEPRLRAYLMESVRPQPDYAERPGRWVAEADWPAEETIWKDWHLNAEGLGEQAGAETALTLTSPADTGIDGGRFCPGIRFELEMPDDQRADDGKSLTFDSPPLDERLEILGAPEVGLEIAADQPQGQIAVRLMDVHPDGAATRITVGVLNLTHREDHEHPRPVSPGERMRVSVKLNDIGYALPAGHRLRVAVSTAYWPLIWPAPAPLGLTLFSGACRLSLPTRDPARKDSVAFDPPPEKTAKIVEVLRPTGGNRRTIHDGKSDVVEIETKDDYGRKQLISNGMVIDATTEERFFIEPDDPLSARAVAGWRYELARPETGWRTSVDTKTEMTADPHHFHIAQEVRAYEGDALIFERRWEKSVPRDSM